MEDVQFLKTGLISNKGLYDNINVYENTIDAFKAAINHNLIIHLKVRLTKDKVAVVYSDNNLTRLMNLKDKISDVTYEELNYLNRYKIPTLKEVLKLINGKVPIIINPRCYHFKYYLEKEITNMLDSYKGEFAILSSNPLIIKWFNKYRPDFVIGEILSRSRKLNKFILPKFIANCVIRTDFKSIDVEYYNIIKIKKIKETSFVVGYLADTKEKYDIYQGATDNMFISELFDNENN